MGIEIERKFLVLTSAWEDQARSSKVIKQGYLSAAKERTLRVRRSGESAFLTIKGPPEGLSRLEFEYQIPLDDAETMLARLLESSLIEKTRFLVPFDNQVWEVDRFEGANAGLVLAEIELEREDDEISLPPWIGEEVSDDGRYSNAYLSIHPFGEWK